MPTGFLLDRHGGAARSAGSTTNVARTSEAVKKKRRSRPWVTYSRCCLITIGSLLVALAGWVFFDDTGNRVEWPVWGFLILGLFVILGSTLIGVGLFASRKVAESWAESADSGLPLAGSLFILIVSAPLFFLLKAFERN